MTTTNQLLLARLARARAARERLLELVRESRRQQGATSEDWDVSGWAILEILNEKW